MFAALHSGVYVRVCVWLHLCLCLVLTCVFACNCVHVCMNAPVCVCLCVYINVYVSLIDVFNLIPSLYRFSTAVYTMWLPFLQELIVLTACAPLPLQMCLTVPPLILQLLFCHFSTVMITLCMWSRLYHGSCSNLQLRWISLHSSQWVERYYSLYICSLKSVAMSG